MSETIFSKIINKEIPAEILFEDDNMIAINDIQPQAPVHILIIPKKNIPTLNEADVTDELLLGKMILLAKKIAAEKGVEKEGYRLVFNVNEGAGQTVFHIHLHLLGGRKFNWPPG